MSVGRALGLVRSALLWVASAIGLACVVLCALALIMGVRSQVVLSGSMAPGIPTGSLLLVRNTDARNLVVGDVVTVDRPDGRGLVTHRVIGVRLDREIAELTLKGDANSEPDPESYRVARVGRLLWSVPEVGRAALFLRGALGRWTGVAILATVALVYFSGSRRRSGQASPGADADPTAEDRGE